MVTLSGQNDQRVHPLIEGAGCRSVSLPAYSPDLMPIEQAFSKINESPRRAGTDAVGLAAAITAAMAMVPTEEAQGWFTYGGYTTQHPLE